VNDEVGCTVRARVPGRNRQAVALCQDQQVVEPDATIVIEVAVGPSGAGPSVVLSERQPVGEIYTAVAVRIAGWRADRVQLYHTRTRFGEEAVETPFTTLEPKVDLLAKNTTRSPRAKVSQTTRKRHPRTSHAAG